MARVLAHFHLFPNAPQIIKQVIAMPQRFVWGVPVYRLFLKMSALLIVRVVFVCVVLRANYPLGFVKRSAIDLVMPPMHKMVYALQDNAALTGPARV